MKATATLKIRLSGIGERKSLQAVISPDNEGAPRGMKLGMSGTGSSMSFTVETGLASASLSTILAVLRDVSLFQEIWLLARE